MSDSRGTEAGLGKRSRKILEGNDIRFHIHIYIYELRGNRSQRPGPYKILFIVLTHAYYLRNGLKNAILTFSKIYSVLLKWKFAWENINL